MQVGESITIKNLFTIQSIITLFFGVAFIVAPHFVISLYGGEVSDMGALVGRYFGSSLLMVSAVVWLARDVPDSPALQAILKGFFVTLIIGALVSLIGVLDGTNNALGWLNVLIYGGIAFGYGRILFGGHASRSESHA